MNKNININHINSFLISASMVFKTLLNVDLKKGKLSYLSDPEPSNDIVINIDISGNVKGLVLYSLGFNTLNKIASTLVPDMSEEQIKEDYKDIAGELANMITGNAITLLADHGLDISTPTVMSKDEYKIRRRKSPSMLSLNLYSPFGQLEILMFIQ